jgi:hypothetical protein
MEMKPTDVCTAREVLLFTTLYIQFDLPCLIMTDRRIIETSDDLGKSENFQYERSG